MKIAATCSLLFLFSFVVFFGCKKQVVDPNFTGSIKGQVLNSETGKGISFVSVSTNPGTNAILTDSMGHFNFKNIPTGNYTIKAYKDGFQTALVHVNVERNETTTAMILLEPDNEESTEAFIKAQVTNFFIMSAMTVHL